MTIEEDVYSLAVETTTSTIEWEKGIFASILNVEQAQWQIAIYGVVINAKATRWKMRIFASILTAEQAGCQTVIIGQRPHHQRQSHSHEELGSKAG